MFSSQTGACHYFNGITNIATPFVRSACFEPAYRNTYVHENTPHTQNSRSSLLCMPIRGTQSRGACAFDQECGPAQVCQHGVCKNDAPYDARNSVWRREYSRVVGYAPRNYKSPDGQVCRQQPYYVVDETNRRKVVCPILTSYESQPQCSTCINTLFNCDRFRETDPTKYRQCREMQRTIHYQIVTPNGQLIPMGAEMDGDGMKVMNMALRQCGTVCGSCTQRKKI